MSTGVQAIETGLVVLDVLASHKRPMMLKDIAASAGMHPAKVHRYLVSLQEMKYAEQDATGLYRLGVNALRLGLACMEQIDALRMATQVLDELNARSGESVFAAIWGSHGPTIIHWRDSSHPVTVNVRPGSVMPLLRSATGRVFLAYSPPEMLTPFLENELRIQKPALEGVPATLAQAWKLAASVRQEGVGRVCGQMLKGVSSVSAPVFDYSGKLVLALTMLGSEAHFDASDDGPSSQQLRKAAEDLSTQLGYRAVE